MENTLDRILGYVDRLAEVDLTAPSTDGLSVPETEAQPVGADRLRRDDPVPVDPEFRRAVLSNFPDRQGDLLRVPGVFEHPKG